MVGYSRDDVITSTRRSEEKENELTLEQMQMEALGFSRVELLQTTDYKENKYYVPAAHIERRLDSDRFEQSRVVQGKGNRKLEAWNNAWTTLGDDGTAADGIQNVNEGLGQTHRGKLQADESVRLYSGEEPNYRGGFRTRGGHYASRGVGRGGGFAGPCHGGGRQAAAARSIPAKRTRVAKSRTPSNLVFSTEYPFKMNDGPKSLLKQVSTPKPAPSTPPRHSRPHSSKVSGSRPITDKATTYAGRLATPDSFMATILQQKKPPSKEQVEGVPAAKSIAVAVGQRATDPDGKGTPPTSTTIEQSSKATTLTNAVVANPEDSAPADTSPASQPSMQADLLDDVKEEASGQTVIAFTHSANSKGPFEPSMPTSDQDQKFFQNIEILQGLNGLTSEQIGLLEDLKSQVQARMNRPPKASVSNEQKPQPVDVDTTSPVPPAQPVITSPVKLEHPRSIAKELIAQRDSIIGEHVHRTRFQHSALIEKFQKLKISGHTAAKLAQTKDDDELSKTNPFGPAKTATSKGPSLPAHLAHLAPVTDPGAAARAQYSSPQAATRDRTTTSTRSGPSLPANLASLPPVTDAGAAARAQYNSTNISSRGRGILSPVSNGQLRSFDSVSANPSTDSVLTTPSAEPVSAAPSAQVPAAPSSRSMPVGPSSKPAISTPSPAAPAPRKSMLNQTGFIGLAGNRAQATKKGDDPLVMARKRGV